MSLFLLSAVVRAGAGGSPVFYGARIGGDEIAVVAIVFGVGGALLFPLIRAFARRLEDGGRAEPLTTDIGSRLERMERGMEAMAVEIERISEGQRFVTKLLAERADATRLPPVQH